MQTVKYFRCKDTGMYPKCDQMIEGQTDEEVLQKAREHAKSHHERNLTDADIEKIRGKIIEKTVSC